MTTLSRFVTASLCALAAFAPRAHAQKPTTPTTRAALLVTPDWVAQHLRDPNIVFLHVGVESTYKARHLPGAQLVNLMSLSTPRGSGLALEMPPSDSIRAALARLGISNDSRVIIYQSNGWVTPSSRVALTLEYAGLGAATSMLDGGLAAWEKAGHPVTADIVTPKEGKLAALRINPVIADAEYVRARIGKPGVSIIDAREASFYDGVEKGNSANRAGHIESARSVPFNALFDEHNLFLPPDSLAAVFTRAGVAPKDTIIGYCHIGQYATAMLFAARTLGHPVLLYDGSYQDWGPRDATYPVTTAPAVKRP